MTRHDERRRREDQQRDRAQRRAHAGGEVGVGGQDRAGDRDAEGTFPASLFVLRDCDLIGLVGSWSAPLATALGLVLFEVPLPLPLPPLGLGLAWHPRHDADPAHAWLRRCVRELMTGAAGPA